MIPMNRRLLLSSDFDDTLFASKHAADKGLHEHASAAFCAVFPRLRHPPCGTPARLVLNTGRTLPLFAGHPDAEARMEALGLKADVLIAGVGTRVYWRRQQHDQERGKDEDDEETEDVWIEDDEWTATVGAGWDAALARQAVERALRAPGMQLRQARLNRDEELHAHKLTVSLDDEEDDGEGEAGEKGGGGNKKGGSGESAAEALGAEMLRLFAELGASREPPRLVTGPCAAPAAAATAEGKNEARPRRRRRRFIDVLPQSAGKGSAMLYVASKMGYDPRTEVCSAGDSQNDTCMLSTKEQRRAVVVGNAHPEVKAALRGLAHVWVAPEGCVGAGAVLRGLCAEHDEDGGGAWVEAAAVAAALDGGDADEGAW